MSFQQFKNTHFIPSTTHASIRFPSTSSMIEKCLTAKDGRSQVLDPRDGGGQAGYNACNPIEKGGVGGHGQNWGLDAADLFTLHHNSETHGEVVSPPQGSHHSFTHKPVKIGEGRKQNMHFISNFQDFSLAIISVKGTARSKSLRNRPSYKIEPVYLQ